MTLRMVMMAGLAVASVASAAFAQNNPPAADTAAASAAPANGSLDAAMGKLAQDIGEYLKDRKEDTILVGTFSGPPGLKSTNGNSIKKALTDKLKAMNLRTDGLGREIRGSYRFTMETVGGTRQAHVKITCTMITRNGDEDLTFVKTLLDVANEEDVVKLVGATTALPTTAPPGTPKEERPQAVQNIRQEQIAQSIEKPAVSITVPEKSTPDALFSVVSATPKSPYRIEMLIYNAATGRYEPASAEDKGGLAFVRVGGTEKYAVRIINDADHDVGVKLFLDGLSMFEFTEVPSYRKLQMVWIGAHSSGLIKGWHVHNDDSLEFQIVDLPKSAAFQRNPESGDIGAVTAMFFPSWVGDVPLKIEPTGQGRSANQVGTACGERIKSKYGTKVANFGVTVLSSVTIRYNIPDDLPAQ